MKSCFPVPDVQLWAPGQNVEVLISRLSEAGILSIEIEELDTALPATPLLLLYAEPALWIRWQAPERAEPATKAVVEGLSSLFVHSGPFRLVNVACLSIPMLVGWCIDPRSKVVPALPCSILGPRALEAILALKLLQRHQDLAGFYLALERHPHSASLDGRPPDLGFVQRYNAASSSEYLLAALAEQDACERELVTLARRLSHHESDRADRFVLEEAIQELTARLEELDVLRDRCSDLQLSLQAQQADLEVVSRRMALLQDLISVASAATTTIQLRMSQVSAT